MDSFTFVINSKNSTTANTANNCFIKLAGLPNNQKFLCEVIDFAINITSIGASITDSYIVMTADSEMQILNGVEHPAKFDRICNISIANGLLTGNSGHIFKVENFNNHTVNFQLGLSDLSLLPGVSINYLTPTHWTLSLKMTPIE